jgi:hypothetical protein
MASVEVRSSFFENTNFLLEIFDDQLLVAIDPTTHAHEQEGQGIHAISIP